MSERSSLTRRVFVASAAAAAVAGCKGETPVENDGDYPPRVQMKDVDDSLRAIVEQSSAGERVRVVYKNGGAIRGAVEPLVTLVEFSDFQCPFCGAFAQTLEEFLVAYPQDLRLVFMQFPLPMHPNAKLAAQAAIAAQQQQRFWSMHDRMFANRNKLSEADLVAMATDMGLDKAAFKRDLHSEATQDRLTWEMAIGRRLGVRGTPHFFVNGRRSSGAMPPEDLRTLIEQERALALSLMEAGAPRPTVYAHINRAASVAGAPAREPSPATPG